MPSSSTIASKTVLVEANAVIKPLAMIPRADTERAWQATSAECVDYTTGPTPPPPPPQQPRRCTCRYYVRTPFFANDTIAQALSDHFDTSDFRAFHPSQFTTTTSPH